jgi:signal transduction histidine kinase
MPERAQAALDLMVADIARFQGLVEDLLEISRFDAGAVRLHREELLVAEFVRQAVAVSSRPDTPIEVSEAAELARRLAQTARPDLGAQKTGQDTSEGDGRTTGPSPSAAGRSGPRQALWQVRRF